MSKSLRNPAIGHRIIFLQTAVQTNDRLLQVEHIVEQPESKPVIPLHMHLKCSERFEVVSGQLRVILDGKERKLNKTTKLYLTVPQD